jgi:hypothetical protein
MASRIRRAALVLALLVVPSIAAADECRFTMTDAVMLLESDCTTTASIEIPDGYTLDGNFHRIVALPPQGRLFTGGVVVGLGTYASVINTSIEALVPGGCTDGTARLRGIYFEGASGVIRNNIVQDINRGASACEDGNAIEVRNALDALEPVRVEISDNVIERYQKSGVVVHGRVDAVERANRIGTSVSQEYLAANAIQVGLAATAQVERNTVAGNRFTGAGAAGTAILLIASGGGTAVRANSITGNADVGIYVMADSAIVEANELADEGADGFYDIGIADVGVRNVIIGNAVQGFRTSVLRMDRPAANNGSQLIE